MNLDVEKLITDAKELLSSNINKDISTLRGFSIRQLNGIANQSALIATGIANGEITSATRDFFLEQLVELAHNFVNTLVGLLIATIEKLWNALVELVWKTISEVIGYQLPPFTLI